MSSPKTQDGRGRILSLWAGIFRSKYKWVNIVLLSGAGLLAAVFLMLLYVSRPIGGDAALGVVIQPNSTTSQIAHQLKDEDLIRSYYYFIAYTRLTGNDASLQAGTYQLSGADTVPEIVAELKKGCPETLALTVPEGYNLEQIADLMVKKGLCTKEEFMDAEETGDFDFPYMDQLPAQDNRFEGFLFPDTYDVAVDSKPAEVIQMMLRQFTKVYNADYQKRAKELGLSTLEVVTLASIVEREAKKEEERPIIAAVFENRLKRGMMLQSCATVQYALGEVKPVLYDVDLKVDSPYNTYLYNGLPPGPIASPGEASIKAVLYPADTTYLYFVAKPDGSHAFSHTLQEHLAAKAKYEQK